MIVLVFADNVHNLVDFDTVADDNVWASGVF